MKQKNLLEAIKKLEKSKNSWFVAEDSLKLMLQYIRQADFETVLEIGAHIGYSALNFALIAKHVTTIEKDKVFIEEAKVNLAPFKDKITLIYDDALKVLGKFIVEEKKFDCIFIDAHKPDYANFLNFCIPLLNDNGAIFIDNTISHKNKVTGFWNALEVSGLSYKELGTGDGLIIAFKTRKFFDKHNLFN